MTGQVKVDELLIFHARYRQKLLKYQQVTTIM